MWKILYEKVLYFFKRTHKKYNWFWKEEKEELKSYHDANVCYICRKGILKKFAKDKNYRKVWDHCHHAGKYRGAAHNICNLESDVPNEIPVVFHNS